MQDLQVKHKAEVEREARKALALQEEQDGDTEDRKLMLDKIRREQAALYNNQKDLPVYWRPVNEERKLVSFARSIGYNTQKL